MPLAKIDTSQDSVRSSRWRSPWFLHGECCGLESVGAPAGPPSGMLSPSSVPPYDVKTPSSSLSGTGGRMGCSPGMRRKSRGAIASAALLAIATMIPAVAGEFGDHTGFASASQTTSPDIRIGTAASDDEAANPTTGGADADDTNGTDDEDLTMPTFTVGRATSLSVPVTINTAGLTGGPSLWDACITATGLGGVLQLRDNFSGVEVSDLNINGPKVPPKVPGT